jgi:hypothetical protein
VSGGRRPKVRFRLLGEAREAPAGADMLSAMILAGRQELRGCGCRQGVCRECETLYRPAGGGAPVKVLACDTTILPDIDIVSLPFPWIRAFRRRRGI